MKMKIFLSKQRLFEELIEGVRVPITEIHISLEDAEVEDVEVIKKNENEGILRIKHPNGKNTEIHFELTPRIFDTFYELSLLLDCILYTSVSGWKQDVEKLEGLV